MVKNAFIRLFVVMVFLGIGNKMSSKTFIQKKQKQELLVSDKDIEKHKQDSVGFVEQKSKLQHSWGTFSPNVSLDVPSISRSPFISLQQLLKGNTAGVYVQENNGEPGSIQSMLIHGLSAPVFSNKDISGIQPVVYLNGVPLLLDNPFSYDVKLYDVNPLGGASNILAGLDLGIIESMEVIKDPLKLAQLGPLASKGAIWIQTKDGYWGGKHFSVDGSLGFVTPPSGVKMTNAGYERAFRQNFFDTYGILNANQYLPKYLQDDRDDLYFGEPDWADSYYRYAPQYNLNVTVGGGNPMANYLFTLGTSRNAGVADETGYNKYNIGFFLNMVPLKGLTATAQVNGGMSNRSRNRNFRDHYAEVEYLPDFSTPIAPTKIGYSLFMSEYDKVTSENDNDMINGYLGLNYKLGNFVANAKLQLDYNTNDSHLFFPSTLMESVSFVSDYSAYNRRLRGVADIAYLFRFGKNHLLNVKWDGSFQSDLQHYNYTRAYDGDDDKKTTTASKANYKLYRYADRMDTRLVSTSFYLEYTYKELVNAGIVVRSDGTSKMQMDNRWLFTPAFNIGWNVKKQFWANSPVISNLFINASWARMGKLLESDRFALGPQYSAEDMNWIGQTVISSQNGLGTITRPYSRGWVGYGIGWPYAEKLNIELAGAFLNDRLKFSLGFYNNYDKDQIIQMPVPQEYGYKYQFKQGMDVNNRGIDFSISSSILSNPKGINWDASLNVNYNWNELKRLPEGVQEVTLGDRKLTVGKSIDQFWLLQNIGIYQTDEEVPVIDGKRLSINGIPLKKGDPIWVDQNGDNMIDDQDKVMKGHMLPPFTGGFMSEFRYKRFDLSFNLFWAVGHHALNNRSWQRYDFMTLDNQKSLAAVKEIFFWQNTNDKNDYPIYNPLSKTHPYRQDQDLFLEKLSYLKLRTLTLGYTLPLKKKGKYAPNSIYLYLTANNLFTITAFSGDDPELIEFNGCYSGYAQSLPRSLTAGFKFNF